MAFPKRILWIPIGWSNRGNVEGTYVSYGVEKCTIHSLCKTRAKIGLEKGGLFLYCPKCLVKLEH